MSTAPGTEDPADHGVCLGPPASQNHCRIVLGPPGQEIQAAPTSVTISISSRINQERSVARVPWVTALSVPLRRRISETGLEREILLSGRPRLDILQAQTCLTVPGAA